MSLSTIWLFPPYTGSNLRDRHLKDDVQGVWWGMVRWGGAGWSGVGWVWLEWLWWGWGGGVGRVTPGPCLFTDPPLISNQPLCRPLGRSSPRLTSNRWRHSIRTSNPSHYTSPSQRLSNLGISLSSLFGLISPIVSAPELTSSFVLLAALKASVWKPFRNSPNTLSSLLCESAWFLKS